MFYKHTINLLNFNCLWCCVQVLVPSVQPVSIAVGAVRDSRAITKGASICVSLNTDGFTTMTNNSNASSATQVSTLKFVGK